MLSECDARLIEREIPYLRRFARARVGDPDYADDLVQACLEKAIVNFDKYQSGTNLRAWLLTILRNHHISEYRKNKRQPQQVSYDLVEFSCKSPERQLKTVEFKEVITLFQRLSAADREIIFLVAIEGLKYEEAADVLNVAVGTVRSRLSRARMRLRMLMEKEAGTAGTAPLKQLTKRLRRKTANLPRPQTATSLS